MTLAYGELLRRYGTPELVDTLSTGVRWARENLGAFPRPLGGGARRSRADLGHPHARAPPAGLVGLRVRGRGHGADRTRAGQPARSAASSRRRRCSTAVVVGLMIGFLLIRVDLLLTGSGAARERAQAGPTEPARRSAPGAGRGPRAAVAVPRYASVTARFCPWRGNRDRDHRGDGGQRHERRGRARATPVAVGDTVVLLESMKMEIPVISEHGAPSERSRSAPATSSKRATCWSSSA